MKKKIFYAFVILVLTTFISVLFIKYYKYQEYQKSITNISSINYKELTIKGTTFYNKGNYNCFLVFNSNCEFCIDEIEDIVDNIELFKDVNFYLVSNQTEEELIEYNEDSEFLGLENFTILHDKDNAISIFFDYPITPSTFMYNKEDILIDFKKGFQQIYNLEKMKK
jgi:peroxiredoxin